MASVGRAPPAAGSAMGDDAGAGPAVDAEAVPVGAGAGAGDDVDVDGMVPLDSPRRSSIRPRISAQLQNILVKRGRGASQRSMSLEGSIGPRSSMASLDRRGSLAASVLEVGPDRLVQRAPSMASIHHASIGAERVADVFEPGAAELQVPYSTVQLYSLVAVGALIGALVREELEITASYDMFPIATVLYANMLGCFVMGPLALNKAWLICNHYALYIGLGVGLCGSLSSFSTWQLDAAKALVRWPGGAAEVEGGGAADQVMGWVTVQAVGLSASTSALTFGMLWSQALATYDYEFDALRPPTRPTTPADVRVAAGAGALGAALIAFNFFSEGREHFGFGCLFAPLGALCRYRLSLRLNQDRWFPWGTLAANLAGTALLGALTIVLDAPGKGGDGLSRWEHGAAQGAAEGFCGALSTVSTWVFELRSLSTVPVRTLWYGAVSVLAAQALLLLTVGVYRWEHGVEGGG